MSRGPPDEIDLVNLVAELIVSFDALMACLATPLRLLRVAPHELNLATVLKSGQSFRWARFDQLLATRLDEPGPKRESMLESKLGPELSGVEWACGLDDRTICLRQERALLAAPGSPC